MIVRKLTRYLLMLVSLASVHARMQAQTAVDGAIGGTVEDKTGAGISGANIVIPNNGTNAEQNITSDAAGFFRANHLQPGTYTVTISAPNFEAFRSEKVDVTVGSLTNVQPSLAPGSSSEVIEVTSAN